MRAGRAESRWVSLACLISLTLYLIFSRLPRLWVRGLSYHRDLLLGLVPQIRTQLWQFYQSVFSSKAWNHSALLQMALVVGLCILAAELTRKLLGGHLARIPAIPLFAFGYAIIPQCFLALVLWPDGRGHVTAFNEIAILIAAVVLLTVLLITGFHAQGQEIPMPGSQSRLGIWGYLFVVPAAILLSLSLCAGVQSIGGSDALGYHLPLSASLLSTGRTATGPDWQFLYPANMELAIRWFLTPGNDRLADLVPFLTALLCVLILYRICVTIGQTRQAATVAACCLVTVPFVPYLATSAYTDLFASMFTLMAALYLCECWHTGWKDKARIFCCGLAIGLALGSKHTVMPVAFVIFGWALVSLVNDGLSANLSKGEEGRLLTSSSKRKILLLCLSMLPGCAYWFIRNWGLFGNPLYPAAFLGLPGYPLQYFVGFDSYLKGRLWTQLTYPWVEGDFTGRVDLYSYGIGAVVSGIVLPLMLWWPASMLRDRRPRPCLRERWFFYSLALGFLLYFLAQQTMVTRYAVLAILLMLILVGEAWDRLDSLAFRAVTCAAYLVMCAGLIESLAGGTIYRFALGVGHRTSQYDVPSEVDRIPPAVILNAAGGVFTYRLMGSDYRHRVIWLARDSTPEDAAAFKVQYVYLKARDVPTYSANLNLKSVATSNSVYGESFVLAQIQEKTQVSPVSPTAPN